MLADEDQAAKIMDQFQIDLKKQMAEEAIANENGYETNGNSDNELQSKRLKEQELVGGGEVDEQI
jgi:hypothetical protein